MSSISLCMIVKDEELMLPRCLESVRGVVDDIIVVDTGSTDQTIAIAKQGGAAVYPHPWQDDFAIARNQSLQYAQTDWILVLDADEVLLPEAIPALLQVVQSPDCLAVTLLRQERGTQQNPYTLVSRLFRRHPQLQFQRPYHESIDEGVMAVLQQDPQWRVHTLDRPVIAHEGYRADVIAQRQKTERAARIMERYLKAHPEDAYLCSKLGALYVTQGQQEQGLTLLKRGLATTPPEASVQYELHYHLGLAYSVQQQWEFAQHHYEAALAVALPDTLKLAAAINLAAIYMDHQAWLQAEMLLLQVLQTQPTWAIAYYNLGLLYKAQQNYPAAVEAYQRAIQYQPQSPEAHQNLGVVYLKQGCIPEGLAAFRAAIALHAHHNPAEAQRLRQTLAEMGWSV